MIKLIKLFFQLCFRFHLFFYGKPGGEEGAGPVLSNSEWKSERLSFECRTRGERGQKVGWKCLCDT